MKKLLALLMLLLFLLLTFCSWKWYKKTVLCCADSKEKVEQVTEKVTETSKVSGPLVYNWNNSEAITNEAWATKQQEIISGMKDGSILQIVGPYFSDETNSSSFENMGLARAESVKKLFEGKIDMARIETSAKLNASNDEIKSSPFELTDFNWSVRNENIKEVAGKTLIYFPSNSSNKLNNSNINNYLKDVAKSVQASGKSITLIGHTDSRGNANSNKALALKRANTIKDILVADGVAFGKVTTSSNGEETPIASNDTEEGRQKNRRVELQIK